MSGKIGQGNTAMQRQIDKGILEMEGHSDDV